MVYFKYKSVTKCTKFQNKNAERERKRNRLSLPPAPGKACPSRRRRSFRGSAAFLAGCRLPRHLAVLHPERPPCSLRCWYSSSPLVCPPGTFGPQSTKLHKGEEAETALLTPGSLVSLGCFFFLLFMFHLTFPASLSHDWTQALKMNKKHFFEHLCRPLLSCKLKCIHLCVLNTINYFVDLSNF